MESKLNNLGVFKVDNEYYNFFSCGERKVVTDLVINDEEDNLYIYCDGTLTSLELSEIIHRSVCKQLNLVREKYIRRSNNKCLSLTLFLNDNETLCMNFNEYLMDLGYLKYSSMREEYEEKMVDYEEYASPYLQEYKLYELQRDDVLSWDETFLAACLLFSMRSKDPSTQVGAFIVDKNNRPLSFGYNGTPNGFKDEYFKWNRDGEGMNNKYMYVVHAERNAILNYGGSRQDLEGSRIYVALFPCNQCAIEIVQAGIKEVIYLSDKYKDTESTIVAKEIFDTAGVKYRQFTSDREITLRLKL